MQFKRLLIPDLILLEPKIFFDERGFFFESFNQQVFDEIIGAKTNFVQDNHSLSSHGVLRGMHYQSEPEAQAKLVRVLTGEIYDVAIDMRKNSPTYMQWVGEYLSAENKKQLWIPEGFAHGFLTTSASAEVAYKTTKYYSPQHEHTLLWNDPTVGVKWPQSSRIVLAAKDS